MRRTLSALACLSALALAAVADAKTASIGQPAPDFTLKDTAGKDVSLADLKGKTVVLEWVNPQCPYVKRHYNLKTMNTLADRYKDKDVVWLGVATGDTANAGSLKSFASKNNIAHPILLDPDGKVAKAYGAKTTPHMFIVDKDGKLAYAGGIDSKAIGDESAPIADGTTNYVDQALTALTTGQSVPAPETKSYGCSVKYKD
jgi:peroxiredoxin